MADEDEEVEVIIYKCLRFLSIQQNVWVVYGLSPVCPIRSFLDKDFFKRS